MRHRTFHDALRLAMTLDVTNIVETGTTRRPGAWDLDGQSTYVFGAFARRYGCTLWTCDRVESHIEAARRLAAQFEGRVEYVVSDSVEFLERFRQPIDLLYLDSLDFDEADPGPPQMHALREAQAALHALHDRSLILIDDCDLAHGGKGGKVIPFLRGEGWQVVSSGYQVLLARGKPPGECSHRAPAESAGLSTSTDTARRRAWAVLVTCARTRLDAAGIERLRGLCRERLDWGWLRGRALAHGLAPVLRRHLRAHGQDQVPPAILADLDAHAACVAAHDFTLARELVTLAGAFADAAVRFVPVGGPVLAETLYGDLGLREFARLDILIHPADLPRASRLLQARGYRVRHPSGDRQSGGANGVLVFERGRDRAAVALHSAFPIAWTPDPEMLWSRLQPGTLLGRPVPTLPAEMLLLTLCVHGATHLWARLGSICDVAELLRAHPALAWTRMLEHARRTGALRMVLLGTTLAAELLDAPVPEAVLESARADRVLARLVSDVRASIGRDPALARDAVGRLRVILALRERWRDRVRQLLRWVFTPTEADRAALPLPPGLEPLHRAIRPFRLAIRHGTGLVRRPLRVVRRFRT
jgi:hypothetical protein